jgi:Cupin domain
MPDAIPPVDLASLAAGRNDLGALWWLGGEDLQANLVRLGPGDRIAPHRNDEVEVLVVVVSGRGELTLDGQVHQLAPMVVAHLPKGTVRAIEVVDGPLAYLSVHRRRSAGLQVGRPAPATLRSQAASRQGAAGSPDRPAVPLGTAPGRSGPCTPRTARPDGRGPGQPGPPEHPGPPLPHGRDQRAGVLGPSTGRPGEATVRAGRSWSAAWSAVPLAAGWLRGPPPGGFGSRA